MSKKYVIEFAFYEENGDINSMFLFTDDSRLKGRYIPENCFRIKLYTRSDYELLNILSKIVNDNFQEIEQAVENANDFEELNQLIGTIENFVSTKGKEILAAVAKITPIKDVLIGEILMKDSVGERWGKHSEEYNYITQNNADGIIYFEDEDRLFVLDYYFENSKVILGGLSYSGHLELDEEQDELI